jgi:hypothetical protein
MKVKYSNVRPISEKKLGVRKNGRCPENEVRCPEKLVRCPEKLVRCPEKKLGVRKKG